MLKKRNIDLSSIKLGQSNIEKVYLGQNVIWDKSELQNYELYMWLDGSDNPINNKWVDKINGKEWELTGVTHTSNYYEFLNPTSGYSNIKYGQITSGGASLDLGKHWIIIADVELAKNTQSGFVFDFCSYGTTANGYNGVGGSYNTSGICTANIKINGNNGVGGTTLTEQSISLSDTWTRVKLMWKCEKVSSTKSIIQSFMNDGLTRFSNEFDTVQWNKFRFSSSPYNNIYLGRGQVNSSANHHNLRFRMYDFKIYRAIET